MCVVIRIDGYGYVSLGNDFSSSGFSESLAEELIRVNCVSALRMTALVLPRMEARSKGVIVNISSCVSYLTDKNISIYAATKSFVLALANNIRTVYKNQPGTFTCIRDSQNYIFVMERPRYIIGDCSQSFLSLTQSSR